MTDITKISALAEGLEAMASGFNRNAEEFIALDDKLGAALAHEVRGRAALVSTAATALRALLAARDLERRRACILLEACWEAVTYAGVTDCISEDRLIPAILAADGDPEYARQTLADMGADLSALSPAPKEPEQ